ncbi:MAG: O-antigen ligase family protein [Paramuribaculum sp.]|nr:O-antigen ligase family protein [Paramuribaculum sp.]
MKRLNINHLWILCVGIIAIFGLWETLLGLKQLIIWINRGKTLYPMTGSFYNPGPFGGFIGLILPISLSILYKARKLNSYLVCCILLGIILQVFALGLSGSRAGLMGALVGCFVSLYLSIPNNKGLHKIKSKLRKLNKYSKIVFVLSLAIVLGGFLICGYKIKKDSADGRLLIWKIATIALYNNPHGVGWNQVPGAYGEAQESYFASGCGSEKEKMVSGAPRYVFNEFLQISLAWGIFAGILFVVIILLAIYNAVKYRNGAVAGALTSFTIFACASYPLQFEIFRWSLGFLLCAALVLGSSSRKLSFIYLLLLTCIITGLIYIQQNENKIKLGKEIYDNNIRPLYSNIPNRIYIDKLMQITESSTLTLDSVNVIGCRLKVDADVLFEYGHALSNLRYFKESNEVMKLAMTISSDPMILNIIAKNYHEMGNDMKAEEWLRKSINRLPSRIYPHYLLCQLYYSKLDLYKQKLINEATFINNMPIKVNSPAVITMLAEINKMMENVENYD